jgi:hypothetical protein
LLIAPVLGVEKIRHLNTFLVAPDIEAAGGVHIGAAICVAKSRYKHQRDHFLLSNLFGFAEYIHELKSVKRKMLK